MLLVASYAFVSGYSDGGLTTPCVRLRIVPRIGGIATLALAAGFIPLLIGAGVATTLAEKLLPTAVDRGTFAVTVVACSSATALTLAAMRIPTSLGLALLGSIGGFAIGARTGFDTHEYLIVAAATVLAPVVGGALGYLQLAVITRLQRIGLHFTGFFAWTRLGFCLQCLAYGANDSQRIFAIAIIIGTGHIAPPALGFGISAAFLAGALVGLRRSSGTLAKVVGLRIEDAAAGTTAAGTTSLIGAGLGLPLSLSQALVSGLAGAGINRGAARVRWRHASHLASSWVVTMPAAAIPSALIAWSVS